VAVFVGKGVREPVGVRLGWGVTVDRGVTDTVIVGVSVMVGVWLISGDPVEQLLQNNIRMQVVSIAVTFGK
jgi:hypothetical protein